jgi:GNAT superfamily N-acetyltransferase
MPLTYRIALPEDAEACIDLRGKTRENAFSVAQLAAIGVTLESWRAGIADSSMPGHVCLSGDTLVGYVFGDKGSGEVVVLALLPAWEGQGIGRTLLDKLVGDFTRLGFERLFLGCTSGARRRSHGFYRHLGWRSTGTLDATQDEVLEYFPATRRQEPRA